MNFPRTWAESPYKKEAGTISQMLSLYPVMIQKGLWRREGAQTVPGVASVTVIEGAVFLKGRLEHAWAGLCRLCVIQGILHRLFKRCFFSALLCQTFASASHSLIQL